jgi:hypothetical protein
MFKKYYLLTVMQNGVYFNTYIEGSIAGFLVKHSGKKVVVMNSWRISKREYYALKNAEKERNG